MKAHTEWTTEELWKQSQLNFAAHMAIMFDYLQKKGMSIDDFVNFTAEVVIPGWKSGVKKTVEDLMNGILLNVLANGGEVFELNSYENEVTAKVSHLLDPKVTQIYGSSPEMSDRFWDKFETIAEALGMHFKFERTDDDNFLIYVSKSEP